MALNLPPMQSPPGIVRPPSQLKPPAGPGLPVFNPPPGGGPGQRPIAPPPPGPTPPPDFGKDLSGADRNAFIALNDLFTSYGLGTLAPKIADYIKKGYSADTISILLQDTSEYKERFAGNEIRKQKGLPVLSPSQYLSTEQAYRQLMMQAGLPQGFYDQPSDFTQFIGKDVSPTELKSRVDLASQATSLASPEYKTALQRMYGLDASHMTAYFLDEDRALPLIQKQAAAAQIGAEALRHGLQISGKTEDYAIAGVSQQQAAQAYGQIAQQLPDYSKIGASFGTNVNQGTFEQALFGGATPPGTENAQLELDRLASWNRARAIGASGSASGGLARTTPTSV